MVRGYSSWKGKTAVSHRHRNRHRRRHMQPFWSFEGGPRVMDGCSTMVVRERGGTNQMDWDFRWLFPSLNDLFEWPFEALAFTVAYVNSLYFTFIILRKAILSFFFFLQILIFLCKSKPLFTIALKIIIEKNRKSFSIIGNSREILVSVFHVRCF